MAITEYEDNIKVIVEKKNHSEFIYDFLSIYKISKTTITKLRGGSNNFANVEGEVFLKNKLYFKETSGNLLQAFSDIEEKLAGIGGKPRYIIVTDYINLLAKDTKTNDTLDIKFKDLPKYFDFFLAWNGIEKADFEKENPADLKAAERFAKLFDAILKDNRDIDRHSLNLFLIRVLFCLFAEDTGIFETDIFTNFIKSMTKEDGSDMNERISELFAFLDKKVRIGEEPTYLAKFPYVNGQLFTEPHQEVIFNKVTRELIIEAGELIGWAKVNPDILGSMLQAVATEDKRSHLGMHYTSVPNIMKVIKPLFLDDLRGELETAKGSEDKLNELLTRIGKIKFMDPACGSGNFLIITYKELRRLEMDILGELIKINPGTMYVPTVSLGQFYGIEIEDFAVDVTRLSLWIADHQMNKELSDRFHDVVRPTLPLQKAGDIHCGNALRLDWEEILPHEKDDEIYLFGNPPYLGENLSDSQKEEMELICGEIKGYKALDYVACWFVCGSKYIKDSEARFAFVATNSITQGTQVKPMHEILNVYCVDIFFGYNSFKWDNNAKNNANVIVVIIGYESENATKPRKRELFFNNYSKEVTKISPYLTEGQETVVEKSSKPLFFKHSLTVGCRPNDRQLLIFSKIEYDNLVKKYPLITECFRKYIGGTEYINNNYRYILWLDENLEEKYKRVPEIKERLDSLRILRDKQNKKIKPYELFNNRNMDQLGWFIPQASSGGRIYIPMGIIDKSIVISDPNFVLYNPNLWECGILFSRMHNVWVKSIGGKLKEDYRYSNTLLYNTFPVPELSTRRKNEIEGLVWDILDIREEEGGTLAELYGSPLAEKKPKPMNPRLLEAHRKLDKVVERAYKKDRDFRDDSERLSVLLNMYSKMTK